MPVHDWSRVSPNVFHHFHTAWLAEISKALNSGVLPDNYLAALEQSSGDVVPDVLTLHADAPERPFEFANGASGAVAVEESPPQVDVLADVELFPMRQKRISIQHASGDVVGLVELVSPGNKRSHRYLADFVEKIAGALEQGLHVLVLDILPPRKHDPNGIHAAIWDEIGGEEYLLPPDRPLTLASYEAAAKVRAYVQPLVVGDVLPAMPLFLERGWYVRAPLEAAYLQAWNGTPRPWRERLLHPE